MNTISKSIPMWRGITLRLSLLAAVFTAIYKTMDNITVHNFITAPDGLTAAFAYLIVGAWTGLISSLFFAVFVGQRIIDPEFKKLQLNMKALNINAIIAGTISAGSTLFLLWGNQLGDPSALIALGNAVILYTVAYDLLTSQARFSTIAVPTGLVLVGSMMAAFSGSLAITLKGLLFVLVISNGLAALSEVVEQKGTRQSDGVNFFVWRFLWLAITGTLLAIVVSVIRGQFNHLLSTINSGLHYLPWIALTMLFVFLGIGMKLVAKKHDAVSVVLIVYSIQMVLAYPITLIGNAILPGVFGQIPIGVWIWVIRSAGAAFMIWGVFFLQKNNSG